MNTPQAQKKSLGCLPYGCFIALCLIVLVGAGLCYLVVSNIRGAVNQYTTESPMTVATTSMSASAAQSLQGKLAESKKAYSSQWSQEEEKCDQELQGVILIDID